MLSIGLTSPWTTLFHGHLITQEKSWETLSLKMISRISGSTGKKIRELGFKCQDISKLTNFKEMFGGRLKTLNPLIYSSLLYIRDDKIHKKQFQLLNMPEIDIVVVNLYPFKKYLKKKPWLQAEHLESERPSVRDLLRKEQT